MDASQQKSPSLNSNIYLIVHFYLLVQTKLAELRAKSKYQHCCRTVVEVFKWNGPETRI